MSKYKLVVCLLLVVLIFSLPAPQSTRAFLFRMASEFTDPVCKSHEYFRRFLIEEDLRPTSLKRNSIAQYSLLFLQWVRTVGPAMVGTLPGMALRAVATSLGQEPFLHFREEEHPPKQLSEKRKFTLLSWNICSVPAGYPITDGGVLPWSSRIEKVVDNIIAKGADVNCLYEVFDTNSAFHLHNRLKKAGYGYFYFNIGPRALGASSGIFVASKYAVKDPMFIPFPEASLVGRTKFVEKGVFSFDLESEGKSFARVFATHLQHSEEPEFPTPEEKRGRALQMEVLLHHLENSEEGKSLIVTGDLNLDDREYEASLWKSLFEKGKIAAGILKTWGGDAYCADLMGKKSSAPLNLDHTMGVKGTIRSIHTWVIGVGFDPAVFHENALSDHSILFSEIEC